MYSPTPRTLSIMAMLFSMQIMHATTQTPIAILGIGSGASFGIVAGNIATSTQVPVNQWTLDPIGGPPLINQFINGAQTGFFYGAASTGIIIANYINETINNVQLDVSGNLRIAMTPDKAYIVGATAVGASDLYISVISTANSTQVGSSHLITSSLLGLNVAPIAISPTISGGNYTAFVPISGFSTGSNTVYKITINSAGSVTASTSFTVGSAGSDNPGTPLITPDGSTLYVVNRPGRTPPFQLIPVNTSTLASSTAIASGAVGEWPVMSPDGTTIYDSFAAFGPGVHAISIPSGTVTLYPGTGSTNPSYQNALSSDGVYLCWGNSSISSPAISVFNTVTKQYSSIPLTYNFVEPSGCAALIEYVSAGQLDTSFGDQGITLTPISRADTLQAMAIQPNDAIVIAGTTQTTAPSLFVGRFTANGSLDTSGFNASGSTPGYQTLLLPNALACAGNATAIDSSGNILVAGYAALNPTQILLARYTSAGVLDTTFPGGSGPGYTTLAIGQGATANAIGIQSTGDIIVGGTSVNNGIPGFTLARFTSNGTLDTSFGGSGTGYVVNNFGNISILNGLGIAPNDAYNALITHDSICAVGAVDNAGYMAVYDPNGNPLTSNNSSLPNLFANTNALLVAGYGLTGSYYQYPYSSSALYSVVFDEFGWPYIAGSGIQSGIMYGFIGNIVFGAPSLFAAHSPSPSVPASYPFNALYLPATSGPLLAGGYLSQTLANGLSFNTLLLSSSSLFGALHNTLFYSVIAGGSVNGNLANQLFLSVYASVYTQTLGYPSDPTAPFLPGTPLYFANNFGNDQLTLTIGSNTAATALGVQSTSNIITAGTADGTYCLTRVFGY